MIRYLTHHWPALILALALGAGIGFAAGDWWGYHRAFDEVLPREVQ